MTADLGPLPDERRREPASRLASARVATNRWVAATGAHVLVVDPRAGSELARDLAADGIHATIVDSTVDALVEYGRNRSGVVVVAPDAVGVPTTAFVEKVCEYGSPYVIAAVDPADRSGAGPILCAGARAVVLRPYGAPALRELWHDSPFEVDGLARVAFGSIHLDARAYTVVVDGVRLPDLPLKEFELLRALLGRAPEVLEDDELRAALWGSDGSRPSDNTIAVRVGRLRHRLDDAAVIRRVRGRGYALDLG